MLSKIYTAYNNSFGEWEAHPESDDMLWFAVDDISQHADEFDWFPNAETLEFCWEISPKGRTARVRGIVPWCFNDIIPELKIGRKTKLVCWVREPGGDWWYTNT